MKEILLHFAMSTFVTLVFSIGDVSAKEPAKSKNSALVNVEIAQAYVPDGFDDNDNVQITLEVTLADSCYKIESYNSKIQDNKILIYVQASHTGTTCMEAKFLTPQIIDLKIVPTGTYQIVDGSNGRIVESLTVKHAVVGDILQPDDEIYAPVRDAVQINTDNAEHQLVLTGIFPFICMKIQKVTFLPQKKVIVVLPIMGKLGDKPDCNDGVFPFEESFSFKSPPPGRYLLHVRSLNGAAINKLVEIK